MTISEWAIAHDFIASSATGRAFERYWFIESGGVTMRVCATDGGQRAFIVLIDDANRVVNIGTGDMLQLTVFVQALNELRWTKGSKTGGQ